MGEGAHLPPPLHQARRDDYTGRLGGDQSGDAPSEDVEGASGKEEAAAVAIQLFRSKHGLPGHHGHGSHHHNHGRLHHPPHHGSGNHSPRGSTDHGGSSPTVTRRESKVSWTQGIHTGHTSPAGHPSPRSPHPPGSVLATANSSPLSPAVARRGRTLSHDSL